MAKTKSLRPTLKFSRPDAKPESRLQKKVARLEERSAGAAGVVENLVDEIFKTLANRVLESDEDAPAPVSSATVLADGSALQWGAKLARLRVEHPDAAALIQQLIDDSLDGYDEKGGA
jgi:hypothetical protein